MSVLLGELFVMALTEPKVRDFFDHYRLDVDRYVRLIESDPGLELDVPINTFGDFADNYDYCLRKLRPRLTRREADFLTEHKALVSSLVLDVFAEIS